MTKSTEDYNFHLPSSLIAHFPCDKRSESRLLCVDRTTGKLAHQHFYQILDQLKPHDLLVMNNSRVIPARLFGRKASGGKIELLIERLQSGQMMLAHIRASKSPPVGSDIFLGANDAIHCTITGRQDGLFVVQCNNEQSLLSLVEAHGHMPLPPYIEREDQALDAERYQTVYATEKGSVAAPTAGLHFDDELLAQLKSKGVSACFVTLHVGAGTFQPVRVDNILEHKMHSEWIEVPLHVCDAIKQCKQRGGRVIAVGTTSVRCLETANHQPYLGDTDIFIYPGYQFNTVDAMITNFHLPKSTLLMLVSAFASKDKITYAYLQAIEQQYRFFSYGDAMFIY